MFAMTPVRLLGVVIGAVVFAALLAFAAFSSAADATHSWKASNKKDYHWARTINPFKLQLGDNVSTDWDSYLATASTSANPDWSDTPEMDTPVVAGSTTEQDCKPKQGRVEVCSADYGETGWLGLAQIWASRITGHISQGTSKVNDFYFNKADYNTPAWKQLVMCQEVGHTFGLGHQDEDKTNVNLGSCMDYSNDPDGGPGGASETDPTNEYPNDHDYGQLKTIYGHTDSTNTISASSASSAASKIPAEINRGDLNSRAQWGQLVHTSPDGKLQVFEREVNGFVLVTYVKKP